MAEPNEGDLIEIFRGLYQHWAIYVGKGYVIHLAPPSEHAHAGAHSMMSVLYESATVKKEKLCVVVGSNEYHINNILDEKYEPHSVKEILEDAHSYLGQELPYSVFNWNCEHFVTKLRYGKPESRQVQDAVTAAVAVVSTGLTIGVTLAAAAFLDSEEKSRQNEQSVMKK